MMHRLLASPRVLAVTGFVVVLITFLCGFSVFFPAESLRPRLEAEGAKRGLSVTIGTLETTFPLGLAAKNVVIHDRDKGNATVRIDRINFSPLWSRLLVGKVVLAYDAALLGGEITGTMQRRGPFTLQGAGLTWRGPLPGLSSGILVTRLRQIELSAFWPAQADDALSLTMNCEETAIEGLLGAKNPLLLGNLTLNAGGKGKDLRLTTLTTSGGQLDINGSGSILLSQPLGRSMLNLNLSLRGQSGLDPTLAELLAAFAPPGTDGTSRLRLAGPLSSPQSSSGNR